MAITVNIINDNEGVELIVSGSIHGHEIISANEKIAHHERLADFKYHLIDKSNCTEYNVTSDDIFKIAQFDTLYTQVNPHLIIAIVESKTLTFSLAKLWQHIVREKNLNNKIFTERKSALQWIDEQTQPEI